MANLRDEILEKYSIDISKELIFKLYKIDDPNISAQALQKAIDDTRKRWNQSVNGANERIAERDRERLEKADRYEAILRDENLRQKLFQYYNAPPDTRDGTSDESSATGISFARDYFSLIATSKTIKRDDVEFFFEYFRDERKNKKEILEMLSAELKVVGLGSGSSYSDAEKNDPEGKKKKGSSPLIVNLFQEATVFKLRKCFEFYATAQKSQELQQKYPEISMQLYDFLTLKDIDNIQIFSAKISNMVKETYALRQERGSEYLPLVDLFNSLLSISEFRDVVDNFTEFKLLVKYPRLTPYMYALSEVKPDTIKKLVEIACSEYAFRDETDFLLSYFITVYDNFGISNSKILAIIKKAKKRANANRILNELDEKLGRKRKKVPFIAEIVHWLVYYPILALYLVFEICKAIFTELHRFAFPASILMLIGENWLFPGMFDIDNLLVFGKIFSKEQWYRCLAVAFGNSPLNTLESIVMSLTYIAALLLVYFLPAMLVYLFMDYFAADLNKRYDWIGYERTFQNIFLRIREKTEAQYWRNKKAFYKINLKKVFANVFCTVLIAILVYLAPIGFKAFSEATGYFEDYVTSDTVIAQTVDDKKESTPFDVVGSQNSL